jgi:hypothetical protein
MLLDITPTTELPAIVGVGVAIGALIYYWSHNVQLFGSILQRLGRKFGPRVAFVWRETLSKVEERMYRR